MNIKNTLNSVGEFVADHKVAITAVVTAVATATVCIVINRGTVKEWNEFLEVEGLTDKFYTGA